MIETKTARAKLKPRPKPYFHQISPGLSLGYRRSVVPGKAGTWLVRRADGNGGNTVEGLRAGDRAVIADDFAPANDFDVMDYAQAQRAAGGPNAPRNAFTVADAVALYIAGRRAQGRDMVSSEAKADAWILRQLGATKCEDLTREQIGDWLAGIAAQPVTSREPDPEIRARRRRATANRVLTTLKAALNFCHLERKINGQPAIASDYAWKKLKPLVDASGVRDRWLTLFDAQRLERACQGDFRTLVRGALLTGARLGQLRTLTRKQFDEQSRSLHLVTKKGRSGESHSYRAYLNDEGVAFFKSLCAGKNDANALLFTNGGDLWDDGLQIRLINEACDSAGLVPRITFHGLRHTYASLALQATPPMTLLVLSRNLGHKNTKRVEETYGHLAADHMREAANASAPSFGFTAESKIVSLR